MDGSVSDDNPGDTPAATTGTGILGGGMAEFVNLAACARGERRPSGEPAGGPTVAVSLLLWTLLTVAGIGAAAAPPVPLSLRVSAQARVAVGETRDVAVTIANGGSAPVVVLPNMVRLRIEGAGAKYLPYPGPPVDPWAGARELAPGGTVTIEFRDTSDKRGVWRLPPGSHRITALYEVPTDLALPPTLANPGRVWRDRLESLPVTMSVDR
jgi:hypothetical protein